MGEQGGVGAVHGEVSRDSAWWPSRPPASHAPSHAPLRMSFARLLHTLLLGPRVTEPMPVRAVRPTTSVTWTPPGPRCAQVLASFTAAARFASAPSTPGSTNAEELELLALGNAYYDIERFGLSFVASPRHADILMVTGPVVRNLERRAAHHLRRGAAALPRRRRRRRRLHGRHLARVVRGGRRGRRRDSRSHPDPGRPARPRQRSSWGWPTASEGAMTAVEASASARSSRRSLLSAVAALAGLSARSRATRAPCIMRR